MFTYFVKRGCEKFWSPAALKQSCKCLWEKLLMRILYSIPIKLTTGQKFQLPPSDIFMVRMLILLSWCLGSVLKAWMPMCLMGRLSISGIGITGNTDLVKYCSVRAPMDTKSHERVLPPIIGIHVTDVWDFWMVKDRSCQRWPADQIWLTKPLAL